MNRDEFMELVYETFADEPDNVLANGIIEAADAYVEHEKAQLSQEGTTSDLIDRQQALDIFDDYNVSVENGELEAYSRDRKRLCELPTIQPEVLACGNGELVATPEPQEGHWIWVAGELMCSECRTIYSDLYPDYDNAVACPHCGAKMTTSTK